MILGWRDASDLRSLIGRVSSPASAAYGRYLTPAQFRAAYSPTADAVKQVTSWLRNQGFSVGALPANRMYVPATGTVAQVETAFDTTLRMYRAYGKDLRAPTKALSIPSSLTGIVAGVVGVDDSYKLRHYNYIREDDVVPTDVVPCDAQPQVFYNAPPCSDYWGQLTANQAPPAYGKHQRWVECGLSPDQVRGAYGLTGVYQSGIDGSGQTVAIIDAFASPTIVQDAALWSKRRGLRPVGITQQIFPPNGPVDTGWYGEETLDVESVHGMAPGAHILFVGASDAGMGIDVAQNWIVDNAASHIVSNSYGFQGENIPPTLIQFEEQTFMQAAAEGIGFYFSSGDSGDETITLGSRQTDWPAASDFVTAVGGTSLAVTQSNQYQFETYWGTDKSFVTAAGTYDPPPPGNWTYAAGGGTSQVIAEPDWQKGVVPEQFSGYFGGEGRVVPDISLDGDPNTGFEVGETQQHADHTQGYSEYRIGGTSLSCPLMAGIMALADQVAGSPHGFVAPALYSLPGSVYRDVTAPATKVAVVRNDYNLGFDRDSGVFATLRTMGDVVTLKSIPGIRRLDRARLHPRCGVPGRAELSANPNARNRTGRLPQGRRPVRHPPYCWVSARSNRMATAGSSAIGRCRRPLGTVSTSPSVSTAVGDHSCSTVKVPRRQ
jgi:subtilase family serine protease